MHEGDDEPESVARRGRVWVVSYLVCNLICAASVMVLVRASIVDVCRFVVHR